MSKKSLLSLGSALLIAVAFLSSCNSSIQVAKKRYSKGYYVSIGNDKYESKARPVNKEEKVLTSEEAKVETAAVEEGPNEKATAEVKSAEAMKTVLKEKNTGKATPTKAPKKVSKFAAAKKAFQLKKQLKKQNKSEDNADLNLVLLVLLALLIPPVAVLLVRGLSTPFWISLLLTLLFVLPGVIYALLIVLGVI